MGPDGFMHIWYQQSDMETLTPLIFVKEKKIVLEIPLMCT